MSSNVFGYMAQVGCVLTATSCRCVPLCIHCVELFLLRLWWVHDNIALSSPLAQAASADILLRRQPASIIVSSSRSLSPRHKAFAQFISNGSLGRGFAHMKGVGNSVTMRRNRGVAHACVLRS
jgi:hypothetical protein